MYSTELKGILTQKKIMYDENILISEQIILANIILKNYFFPVRNLLYSIWFDNSAFREYLIG